MHLGRKRGRVKRLSYVGRGVRSVKEVTRHFSCEALTTLNLHSNRLASFDGLLPLQALKDLNLSANCFCTLNGFPQLKRLEVLNFASNALTTCAGLPAFPALKTLTLSYNRLRNLQGLEVLSRSPLATLDVRGNAFDDRTDFPELRGMASLRNVRHDVPSMRETPRDVEASPPTTAAPPALALTAGRKPSESTGERLEEGRKTEAFVVGYPVESTRPVLRERAVQTDRLPQSAETSRPVATLNKATTTERPMTAKVQSTAAVSADLPTEETLKLRSLVERLCKKNKRLFEELRQKAEELREVEKEFSSKLQSVQELAAEKLKQQQERSDAEKRDGCERHEKEMQALQAKLQDSEDAVATLKALCKRVHQDLEKEKEVHAKGCEMAKMRVCRYDEELRQGRRELEALKRKRLNDVGRLSERLSHTETRLRDKEAKGQALQAEVDERTAEMEAARRAAEEREVELRQRIEALQQALQRLTTELAQSRETEATTQKRLEEETCRLEVAKEDAKREKAELESRFGEELAAETQRSFGEGEAHGRQSVEAQLREETHRLKENFALVETKFREAQTETEMQKAALEKRLKGEEEKLSEMQAALQFGVQRSRQRDQLIQEMHAVIQGQKKKLHVKSSNSLENSVVQSLKADAESLEARLAATDVRRVPALEREIEQLRAASQDSATLQDRLRKEEAALSARVQEMRQATAEKEEQLREAAKAAESAMVEAERLRRKNRELTEISDRLHQDRDTFAAAVKVKEAMVDSANESVAGLKAKQRELLKEADELRQCLDETEYEVAKLQRELHDQNEAHEALMRQTTATLENARNEEKERAKKLRERLARSESEYEEKTKTIASIEAEIAEYKERQSERLKSTEEERESLRRDVDRRQEEEKRLGAALADLGTQLRQMEEAHQVGIKQKEKIREVAVKFREENRELSRRVVEVESDMKRLLTSLENERRQSAQKIRKLEHILSELRTPLLNYVA